MRFDWLRESVHAPPVPAGLLVPARSFPARTDVPNWKDLNPRFGIVWDPTGAAKTAIKFGINRYVQSNTTGMAQLFDQAAGAVNSTTRSWNDQTFPVGDPRRSNFLPRLRPGGHRRQRRVRRDGQPQLRHVSCRSNSPDPDWITGWGKRPYNWQTSVNVDREVLPNLSVNAGYFRTWYGNFMVTDNLRVTPADYSPYCVTVPDGPAPAPERPAAVRALRHQPEHVRPGRQPDHAQQRTTASSEEIYNGVDVNFQLRLLERATLGGGWNIGNAVQLGIGRRRQRLGGHRHLLRHRLAAAAVQLQDRRAVSEPHQDQRLLHVPLWHPGWRRCSRATPGRTTRANRTYTLAEIQPSLGRPLSGG